MTVRDPLTGLTGFTDIKAPLTEIEQPPFEIPRTIPKLRYFLQAALALEFLTIPPYLTAMYTIKPGTNQEAWYSLRAVVLEEMLHMTLVANLLNAVGGTPVVADPRFVTDYPAKLPYAREQVPIALRGFGREAIRTGLWIERPEKLEDLPRTGKEPDPRGWTSIGQFYATIRAGMRGLSEKHPDLFDGDPGRQVGPEDFYNSGGRAFPVTDLASALEAIELISEQGEGVPGSIYNPDDRLFGQAKELAHYFRFMEVHEERRYGPLDTPASGPTGPALPIDWSAAYRIDPQAKVADYPVGSEVRQAAEHFNLVYARLLWLLDLSFNGEPKQLQAAVPVMLELRDLALQLYANPHPDPAKAARGVHASATFEITGAELSAAKAELDAGVGATALLASLA
ncbi:ferritin-like domain-containing protein [Streptacidiphilus melanogenes]|uniref:ferritin-like domain-containing protein n=1 Tax=Streptacidiphilus melanogenes TaxID=411235 RepID=UPI000693DDD0|nr:ferritin-like protein [Streptacidiphilus melanogenes]